MVFKRSSCLNEHEIDLKKRFASFVLCNAISVEVSMYERNICVCLNNALNIMSIGKMPKG